MSWSRLFWGWRGRLNQLQFFLGFMLWCIVAQALELLWAALSSPSSSGFLSLLTDAARAPAWLSFLIAPFLFSLMFRRAHDLGFSGFVTLGFFGVVYAWSAILWFWPTLDDSILEMVLAVPAALTAFWFMLKSGEVGENRFGAPPPPGWLP